MTLLRRFLEAVSPEDIRARFHGALRDFSGPLMIRLTQIDYDREIALVGFRDGDELPLGVVRLYAEPDHVSGEFSILVRSDLHGHGMGTALMHRIIALAGIVVWRESSARSYGIIRGCCVWCGSLASSQKMPAAMK